MGRWGLYTYFWDCPKIFDFWKNIQGKETWVWVLTLLSSTVHTACSLWYRWGPGFLTENSASNSKTNNRSLLVEVSPQSTCRKSQRGYSSNQMKDTDNVRILVTSFSFLFFHFQWYFYTYCSTVDNKCMYSMLHVVHVPSFVEGARNIWG